MRMDTPIPAPSGGLDNATNWKSSGNPVTSQLVTSTPLRAELIALSVVDGAGLRPDWASGLVFLWDTRKVGRSPGAGSLTRMSRMPWDAVVDQVDSIRGRSAQPQAAFS